MTLTPIDDRLNDAQQVADAFDALGDFMEQTVIRGATVEQMAALAKFREAWPVKPEPPSRPAPDSPTDSTEPVTEPPPTT